jgi:hypothetical protein
LLIRVLIALACITLNANPASAGYVTNRAAWLDLSQVSRAAYAAGVFDGSLQISFGDRDDEARVYGYDACVTRLGLKNGDLVTLINKTYEDPIHWGAPPIFALLNQLQPMCRDDIDRERIKRGLSPFPPRS